jgi:hypothetical protein
VMAQLHRLIVLSDATRPLPENRQLSHPAITFTLPGLRLCDAPAGRFPCSSTADGWHQPCLLQERHV